MDCVKQQKCAPLSMAFIPKLIGVPAFFFPVILGLRNNLRLGSSGEWPICEAQNASVEKPSPRRQLLHVAPSSHIPQTFADASLALLVLHVPVLFLFQLCTRGFAVLKLAQGSPETAPISAEMAPATAPASLNPESPHPSA